MIPNSGEEETSMPAINLRPSKTGRNMEKVSRKSKLHAVSRLLSYVFKYYPWQFALVIFFVLLSSASSAAGGYFIGNIVVDHFVSPAIGENPSAFDYQGFGIALGVMAGIYLVGIISLYFYNFLMSVVGQGVQKKIRDDLFDHLEELPVSFFDKQTHGDIMSVFTNDVDALREMLSRALPMVASAFVSMIMYFIIMLFTDVYMTIVVIGFSLLIFFISKYYAKMSSKYFVSQQIALGKTNGYIEEMISGQKVVKVFNYEDRNNEGFNKLNEELYQDGTKANRFANVLMPTVNQLGNLQYVIIGLLGALEIINNITSVSLTGTHLMTSGIILSFLIYSKSFVQPIGQISQQMNVMALALAGATRIFKLIDEPKETDDGYVLLVNAKPDKDGNPVECVERTGLWAWKHPHKDNTPTTYTWLKGKITMDDVTFSYLPNKVVLHNVTLFAEPGQKVAFVGPTGAGKTTITNLFTRFYDVADGKIRYDDININKIKKSDLRRSLGMVLQDTKLFTGTVMENIRFGKLDASDEEVEKAAKLANADSFIRLLPQGYDTVLKAGGASLSQGQRQLIAIARAAVADPPVMILDEATSSIDSRTEKLVQEGMDAIMKGRTVFVIAHRLSTVKNSDVIMVLKDGHIVERGNHDELMAKKGLYYTLYTGSSQDLLA
jgi:ATP-binding cassette subfamily B protein